MSIEGMKTSPGADFINVSLSPWRPGENYLMKLKTRQNKSRAKKSLKSQGLHRLKTFEKCDMEMAWILSSIAI